MNKKDKIKYLDNFLTLIEALFTKRRTGLGREEDDIENDMSTQWGIVSEILKSANFDPVVEMEDSGRGKNLKPKQGDIFFDGFIAGGNRGKWSSIEKIKSWILSTKGKIDAGIISVNKNTLPDINLLTGILNTFSDVVSKLTHRRKGHNPFEINDEYDVQDLLFAMIKGAFPTLQYEDTTSKDGLTYSRVDFSINDIKTFVEVKYISKKGQETDIQNQCIEDIQKYGVEDKCEKIIFFVYDPVNSIDNTYHFQTVINKKRTIEGKEIDVMTIVVN